MRKTKDTLSLKNNERNVATKVDKTKQPNYFH